MRFRHFQARSNWREQAAELGYLANVMDDPPYWVEGLSDPFCAEFSVKEIQEIIEPATRQLNELALKAVEYVCFGSRSEEFFDRLHIPKEFRACIKTSWRRGDPSLHGRFDFSYSKGECKLLELNFDTAVSLYEASVFQWIWLDQLCEQRQLPERSDQFNSIHHRLIEAFKSLNLNDRVLHFTSLHKSSEDEDTTRYIESCAVMAGLRTKFLYLPDVGYDKNGRLIDRDSQLITHLFKMYPWEYLMTEDARIAEQFGRPVLPALIESGDTTFFEPVWKCILGNKGILPILWEMDPSCRWLLEAVFEDKASDQAMRNRPHARKPIYGREGGSVSIIYPDAPDRSLVNPSVYGSEGFVLQALHPLPEYERYHLVIGSWVVMNEPAGIGIRADLSPITTGMNCLFVPHFVTESEPAEVL